MLFLGGMCGVSLAGLVALVIPLSAPDQLALTVLGMSACLGAVVRAPVTGILIVFEMTHEFSLVPVLMIGALVSETISRRMTVSASMIPSSSRMVIRSNMSNRRATCRAGSTCRSRPLPIFALFW